MKTLGPLILLAAATAAADPADNYVNFIRQIQADSGLEWDVTVAPEGTHLSPEGITLAGAFFELWSIHRETGMGFMLDEQFVSAYHPEASITITTGDPGGSIPRTRVDQPFSVTLNVQGLLPGNAALTGLLDGAEETSSASTDDVEVQPDTGRVLLAHRAYNYPRGSHALAAVPIGTTVREAYVTKNGPTVLNYAMSNLQGPDLTLEEGEEVFTVMAMAGYQTSGKILDTKRVQVWPIAQASLSGYDRSIRYNDVPTIVLDLKELYPSSTTFVRVYQGLPTANPAQVQRIADTYVVINDTVPQDRVVHIRDLQDYLTKDGPYTMEVLHETPFGTDLLTWDTIQVDRNIEVNGTVYTAE